MKRTLILLSMLAEKALAGKTPFGADKEGTPTPAPSIGERAKIGIRFIFWRMGEWLKGHSAWHSPRIVAEKFIRLG